MIALEFPPCHSSGVQRTLKFAEHLCSLGFEPLILTARATAYEKTDDAYEIPKCLDGKIIRVSCFNLKKLLSIKGKYPSFIEFFDKYWPWYFPAVNKGLKLIKEYRPDVIWSTYPVITAHLIAYKLSNKTNIPWVMDYRDPLRQHYDDSYHNANSIILKLEKKMIKRCSAAVFTTDRTVNLYKNLYPDSSEKFYKVSNGYSDLPTSINKVSTDTFKFLHSGVLYNDDRDITSLILAVSNVIKSNRLDNVNLKFTFRGARINDKIQEQLKQNKVENLFEFLTPIDFISSVREMEVSDAFILVQGDKFQNQVPGKLYEYFKYKKPILTIASKNSATFDEFKQYNNFHFGTDPDLISSFIIECVENNEHYNYDISINHRMTKAVELSKIIGSLLR